jgi:hypothetical protein
MVVILIQYLRQNHYDLHQPLPDMTIAIVIWKLAIVFFIVFIDNYRGQPIMDPYESLFVTAQPGGKRVGFGLFLGCFAPQNNPNQPSLPTG